MVQNGAVININSALLANVYVDGALEMLSCAAAAFGSAAVAAIPAAPTAIFAHLVRLRATFVADAASALVPRLSHFTDATIIVARRGGG